MKIALIGNTLFNQGAEYALAILARGLAAKGHNVDVLLSKIQDDLVTAHPDWKPFELHPHVHVIVNDYRRGRHSIFTLRRLIKQNHYDVVMSHCSPYSIPLVIAALGLHHKPLLVHVQHSGGTGVNDEGEYLQPSMDWRSRLSRFFLRRFDGVFGVSLGTTEGARRMYMMPQEKMFVVYNPVVDHVFSYKLKAKPVHPWLQHPSVPVIVAAGVFVDNKRYQMLIRAFDEVLKEKDARLVIFGKGECLPEYEKIIAELGIGDKVSLPGHTYNLPAELKNATCFVVSSGVESFSVVCVEALAAGTPVVSTNCPYGPPEILQNGKYGILVENKNQHALAEGILKVLNGQGIKPPPESWQPYTAEAIVERYEKAMQKLMENRK